MTKEDSRYTGYIMLKWTTELLEAETYVFYDLSWGHEPTYNFIISKLAWTVSKGQQIATCMYTFNHDVVSSASGKLILAHRRR